MSMAPTVVKPQPIQLLVDTRVNNVRLLITKVVFEQQKTSYPEEMIKISDKKKRKKIRKMCREIIEDIIDVVVQGQQVRSLFVIDKKAHLRIQSSEVQELTTEDTITYEALGLPKNFGGGKIRPNKRRKIKHDTPVTEMDEESAADYWNHLYQTNPEYYYQLYYTYYPEAAPVNNTTNTEHNEHETSNTISSVPMIQCMNSGGDSGNNNNNNSNQSNTSTSGTSNQASGSASSASNSNTGSSGQSGGDGEDNNSNNNNLPNTHATESMVDIESEKKIEEKSPAEIMDRKYTLIEKIMKEMQDDSNSHKEVDLERMQLMMEEIKDADLDYEDIKERLAKAPAKINDKGEFSIFQGHRVVFESEESDSEEQDTKNEDQKAIAGVVGEGVVEEGENELESSEDEDDDLPALVNAKKDETKEEKKVEGEKDEESESSEEEPLDPADAAYEEVKKELETVETKMNRAGKFTLFEGKHMVFSDDSDDEGEEKKLDPDMTPVNIEPEVVGEGEIYSDEEVNEDDSSESEQDVNVNVMPDPKPIALGKGHVKFDYGDSDSDSESESNNNKPSGGDDSKVVGVGMVEMNDDIRFYDEDDSDYKMSEEEEEYGEEDEGEEEEENVEVMKEAFTEQEDIDQNEHRVDKSLMKYWNQRYSLFSKFDEGIQMDTEGWYSVTPEEIARHIAARMYQRLGPNSTVIDAMAGVGGNTIQFATMFPLVFGIEMDPQRALMAKNNAEVYGVDSNIEFVIGDYTCLAPHFKSDAVFLSPPWGGPEYLNKEKFDIDEMPLNGTDLFKLTEKITKNIGYFLPRNTDASQLTKLAGPGESCEIEQNFLYDKLKTITAYYGKLVWVEEDANNNQEPADETVNK